MMGDGASIPIHYWDIHPNFGDLLAPWLVEKMTGRPVHLVKEAEARRQPHYVLIGSILSHVRSGSIVWGTGSFGTETDAQVSLAAQYTAVRGPLTRNRIRILKAECPAIYGDPALLTPYFYRPKITPRHEVGVVIRHSEGDWRNALAQSGIKTIDLKTDRIEETLDAMLSCKRIVTSSLHGLILADAYGIPNAWLDSRSPWGLNFKYWDYLISVDKVRHPTAFDFRRKDLTLDEVLAAFPFDDRPIRIDLEALIAVNPFGWAPSERADDIIPMRPMPGRGRMPG